MSLLCRITKHAKPNTFISNLTRHYSQIHSPSLHLHTTLTPQFIPYYSNYISNFTINQANIQRRQGVLTTRVRFFAAPAQYVKKNKEEKEEVLNRPRLNDEIKSDVVRLVIDEGHSVVSRWDALQRARDLDVDLVEVDRHANPPVCKLMDYKHQQYKRQLKGKEKAKMKAGGSLKSTCKEVRFSTKAELKDLKTKAELVKRLIEKGYRVKCVASGDYDLTGLLSQVAAMIEDVAHVESGPTFEKRFGYLVVRHIKFGPAKGGGSKASKRKLSSEIQKDAVSSSGSTIDKEEQQYDEESSLDTDDEVSGIDSENEMEGPLQGQGQEGTSSLKSSVSNNKQSTVNISASSNDDKKRFDSSVTRNGASASSNDEQRRFDSSVTRNGASTFHPSQAPDSVNSNVSPPSQELGNRYARKVPINAQPMREPMTSSNNRYSPQAQSPVRPPRQGGNEGLPSRNLPPHGNEIRRPRSEMSDRARPLDIKSSGFGILGDKKTETGHDVNQQTNGSPPTVLKNTTVPRNVNPPRSSSKDSAAGDGKKFGIFSGDSSSSGPKRNG